MCELVVIAFESTRECSEMATGASRLDPVQA